MEAVKTGFALETHSLFHTMSCSIAKLSLPTPPDVIHTVGPMMEKAEVLQSCYLRSFQLVKEKMIRSVVSELPVLLCNHVQWNLSIVGTIGTQLAVLCREVSLSQR